MNTGLLRHAVATVLTVYGIETLTCLNICLTLPTKVATVLTVYGIETVDKRDLAYMAMELQQCLPFTVLKLVKKSLI